MKGRTADNLWIPFWGDKWLFGSMRIDFNVAERGVWWDLMAIAMKDDGFIRANEETPYPSQQLSGMLIIEENFFVQTIEKFVKTKKITKMKNGTLRITKWDDYCFTDRYKRKFKTICSAKEEQCSEKREPILDKNRIDKNRIEGKKDIVQQILSYLNEKAEKNFKVDSLGYISARLKEEYSLDDFKKVIDIKTKKWKDDPKMNDYLRPKTLFAKSNFESYLCEKDIKTRQEKLDEWVNKK